MAQGCAVEMAQGALRVTIGGAVLFLLPMRPPDAIEPHRSKVSRRMPSEYARRGSSPGIGSTRCNALRPCAIFTSRRESLASLASANRHRAPASAVRPSLAILCLSRSDLVHGRASRDSRNSSAAAASTLGAPWPSSARGKGSHCVAPCHSCQRTASISSRSSWPRRMTSAASSFLIARRAAVLLREHHSAILLIGRSAPCADSMIAPISSNR